MSDLDWLMRFIDDPRGSTARPRLELSPEEGGVLAQIMADRLTVPLTGFGPDADAAIAKLRQECNHRLPLRKRRA